MADAGAETVVIRATKFRATPLPLNPDRSSRFDFVQDVIGPVMRTNSLRTALLFANRVTRAISVHPFRFDVAGEGASQNPSLDRQRSSSAAAPR